MTSFRLETQIAAPVDVVFDLSRDIGFHERSLADTHERAIAGRTSGLIGLGETVTWRARHFGRWWTMTSRITAVDRPKTFADEQLAGPFRSFQHVHEFDAVTGGTRMIDVWTHEPPFGVLGWLADRLFLARHMRRLLEARNAALKSEAEAAVVAPSRAIASTGGRGAEDGAAT